MDFELEKSTKGESSVIETVNEERKEDIRQILHKRQEEQAKLREEGAKIALEEMKNNDRRTFHNFTDKDFKESRMGLEEVDINNLTENDFLLLDKLFILESHSDEGSIDAHELVEFKKVLQKYKLEDLKQYEDEMPSKYENSEDIFKDPKENFYAWVRNRFERIVINKKLKKIRGRRKDK